MPAALFISPHLDDVAFSCGGTLAQFARRGWFTCLCTVFTATVSNPAGFALRCQTDKGIAPEVDYMALRRAEDRAYADAVGVTEVIHLPFAEAPHRGYHSAPELFQGIKGEDRIWKPVTDAFVDLYQRIRPQIIFAPQGLGNHADHLHTVRAVQGLAAEGEVRWYRELPYAIREPAASAPEWLLPFPACWNDITDLLEAKIAGCYLYASQIGFQFGGPEGVLLKLRRFHREEAEAAGRTGFAERFMVSNRETPPNAWAKAFAVAEE